MQKTHETTPFHQLELKDISFYENIKYPELKEQIFEDFKESFSSLCSI